MTQEDFDRARREILRLREEIAKQKNDIESAKRIRLERERLSAEACDKLGIVAQAVQIRSTNIEAIAKLKEKMYGMPVARHTLYPMGKP